jgi:hypothetical protein
MVDSPCNKRVGVGHANALYKGLQEASGVPIGEAEVLSNLPGSPFDDQDADHGPLAFGEGCDCPKYLWLAHRRQVLVLHLLDRRLVLTPPGEMCPNSPCRRDRSRDARPFPDTEGATQ